MHTIEDGALSSLEKLVHLDLSGNPIAALPTLPSAIETLILDGMSSIGFFNSSLTFSRITTLKSLKTLVMRKNHLRSLPPFVKEIRSLSDVFVDANVIERLTVHEIAPLCKLNSLSLGRNKISPDYEKACQCLHVRQWANAKGIEIRNLSCPEVSRSGEL